MINVSVISDRRFFGKTLRLPLRLVPKSAVVPILQGPLRGKRWIAGSSTHGCWLGTYELAKVREVVQAVRPGMICYDIGAHVGYYSLLLSKLVGELGRLMAFEPLADNIEYLRKHVELNDCGNVAVMSIALSDRGGMRPFLVHENRSMGRLSVSGDLRVRCQPLDVLWDSGTISQPDVIKIDVEGAEWEVLRGAHKLLVNAKPTIFLATHGPAIHRSCCDYLRDLGYQLAGIGGESPDNTDELIAVPNK